MDLLSLLGVLIVIAGFALKLSAILTVIVALIATTFISGLDLISTLETLGTTFVNNRGMAIFITIMLATGTLERNDSKESAATLVKRFKRVSAGVIVDICGVFRTILAVFNASFGGVVGFMRPIILPMALGTIESKDLSMMLEYEGELKGMTSAMEDTCWFFGQILSVDGTRTLLVQSILRDLDYEVTLGRLTLMEVSVTSVALVSASIYFTLKEKRLHKRYYG